MVRNRRETGTFPLDAPVLGWNASSSLTDMNALEAVVMDNFLPMESGVELRKGDLLYTEGLGAAVETLATYSSPTEDQLIAAASSNIYEIRYGVKKLIGTGYSSAQWQTESYNNRLFFVNGVDTPQVYDGTTTTDFGFVAEAGDPLNVDDLINVRLVRNRMWFVEKDTGTAFYGPTGSIAGDLRSFDVGETVRSSKLLAVANWSQDSGSGRDDLTVFIFENGIIKIYQGDPEGTSQDGNAMTAINEYKVIGPLGLKCYANVGGELYVITSTGVLTMGAIAAERISSADAISAPIRKAFNLLSQANRTRYGWDFVEGVSGEKFIINIPTSDTTWEQFVFDTHTLAWGRWVNRDMATWHSFGDQLIGGGQDGNLYVMDHGHTDDSKGTTIVNGAVTDPSNIQGSVMQAYNSLANPNKSTSGQQFDVTVLKPYFTVNGVIELGIGMLVDFSLDTQAIEKVQEIDQVSWEWDTFGIGFVEIGIPFNNLTWETWGTLYPWDEPWEGLADKAIVSQVFSVNARGGSFAIVLNIDTDKKLIWHSTAITFQAGGSL